MNGEMSNDVRERMQETARTVATILPPGTGFVILAFDLDHSGGRLEYISNGNRADIVKVMKEWIAKTETGFMTHQK
jgi:hypothetical protein